MKLSEFIDMCSVHSDGKEASCCIVFLGKGELKEAEVTKVDVAKNGFVVIQADTSASQIPTNQKPILRRKHK